MEKVICCEMECAPPFGDKEDCEFYQAGTCIAPPLRCEGCHWHQPDDQKVKCINLSMDNWIPMPARRCGEYILDEDYRPAEMWTEMTKVIDRVEDLIEGN